MLLDPKYGKYVIRFMKMNKSVIDTEELQKIINRELKTSLRLKKTHNLPVFSLN